MSGEHSIDTPGQRAKVSMAEQLCVLECWCCHTVQEGGNAGEGIGEQYPQDIRFRTSEYSRRVLCQVLCSGKREACVHDMHVCSAKREYMCVAEEGCPWEIKRCRDTRERGM